MTCPNALLALVEATQVFAKMREETTNNGNAAKSKYSLIRKFIGLGISPPALLRPTRPAKLASGGATVKQGPWQGVLSVIA